MIELNNVTKRYGSSRNPVYALKDVSLKIGSGEFICITGKSGCGKTTLLNLIAGMISPTEGEIIYDGQLKSDDRKRVLRYRGEKIGMILQDHSLLYDRTVFSNVELPLLIKKEKPDERKKKVLDWLNRVGMADKIHAYPDQLSGGQQQRVAIARAMVGGADIVLADEPTGSLDEENAYSVVSHLKCLVNDGKTVVMVTHDLDLTEMCDRHIQMKNGIIVSDT
ncbi:MAG: ABC transporter ATP-binding protein [Lachnospiraceae bacterium]|nr:ABC transporter ATP-binding protein [Lachnospiraceae bacterium]